MLKELKISAIELSHSHASSLGRFLSWYLPLGLLTLAELSLGQVIVYVASVSTFVR